MIPRLPHEFGTAPLYRSALAKLRSRGFTGELVSDETDRIVLATDNSIYQVTPAAVSYPRSIADVELIGKLLAEPEFRSLSVHARGGGTGTNGQALNKGLTVDLSRHMNRILEINVAERWARVEPGVVKDQLNAALAPHGLFFAPELSTSDRATIGGMISTDACGQGSCLYGKTRDYVEALTTVLPGGVRWTSAPIDDGELSSIKSREDVVGEVHRAVDAVHRDNIDLIATHFPKLNRALTGYDLRNIRRIDGRFDLNSVLCGSEGTLAFLVEARLRLLPLPGAHVLVIFHYSDFDSALRDAKFLMQFGAASIETIDSRVLDLARGDSIWSGVAEFFPFDGSVAKGVNFIEFVGPDEATAEAAAASLLAIPLGKPRLARTMARGAAVGRVWEMRKKGAGLLGNVQGSKRPIPFVEDVAVPPENLADFIFEFRAALDRRQLAYGMFGHVDAGVLHVRPAIDLKDPAQEILIREVSEEVVALAKKYGGVLWGEHGKGFRSEFVPEFFGPLVPCLTAIKTAFDPFDQMNPGKIASATGKPLTKIDGVMRRGHADRSITTNAKTHFDESLNCNGNGACFNFNTDQAMCPSWKATRQRRHSPKGRSDLLREWLRRLSLEGGARFAFDPSRRNSAPLDVVRRWRNKASARRGEYDFSHVVKDAMDGCLACKACAGTCPIKVDIPSVRSKFLALYYGRYPRPLRDHLVAALEGILPWASRVPMLYRFAAGAAKSIGLLRWLGLVDLPRLSGINLKQMLAESGIREATASALQNLNGTERARSVIVVQDAFTSHFETDVVLDTFELLVRLGFRPWLAPFRPNGKPQQVLGLLNKFKRTAARNAESLMEISAYGIPMIGLDPSMTLTYRAEYTQALGRGRPPKVHLIQEWLVSRPEAFPRLAAKTFQLLPHCTERTNSAPSLKDWQTVFERSGLTLDILDSGCCGMAGLYGHEAEHREMSEQIYNLSWRRHVETAKGAGMLPLATGYSCRSQATRFGGVKLPHPVQALLACVLEANARNS